MLAVLIIAAMSTLGYMIKRQGDSNSEERKEASGREARMADRINSLEDKISKLQGDHAATLVKMVGQVTDAIAKATDAQIATRETLVQLAATMASVNGDLKQLCHTMQLSPCLLTRTSRGGVRVVDKDGNEIASIPEDHRNG